MLKTLILTYFLIIVFTLNSEAQDFWQRIILSDTIVPSSAIAFNSQGSVFLGTEHGVYESINEGITWEYLGLSLWVQDIDITQQDELYVGGSGANLYYSNNSGNTWTTLQTIIPGIICLKLVNSDSILLAGSTGGLYKSSDSGYTWTQVLSTVNSEVFNDIIEKDTFLFAGSTHFLSSSGGGVYRSADDGDTWEHIAFSGAGVYSFAIDQFSNLLAGIGFVYSGWSFGVWQSIDNGVNWNQLLNKVVLSLAVDDFGGIYAGCGIFIKESNYHPVYYSTDNGQSWGPLDSGMHADAEVNSIAVSPENYLYAVTSSPNHLFRSVNPIVSISEKSREQLDIKVFPNPFQDRINLHINGLIYNNEKLIIKIFNSLGQIIYSCENSVNNEFSINLEKLPSGLYYCLIITGTVEHNIKLIKN